MSPVRSLPHELPNATGHQTFTQSISDSNWTNSQRWRFDTEALLAFMRGPDEDQTPHGRTLQWLVRTYWGSGRSPDIRPYLLLSPPTFQRIRVGHTVGQGAAAIQPTGFVATTLAPHQPPPEPTRRQVTEPRTLLHFQADQRWFRANKAWLLGLYQGKRIAIVDGAVVDVADDLPTLAKRVWGRYGKVPIYMPLVSHEPRVIRVPLRPVRRRG